MKFATLEGRRLAIWGLGREGQAALKALRRHLPRQPVTVYCSAAEAASVTHAPGVTVCTGAPDGAMLSAHDFVIKSPGISIYKPEVLAAQVHGTVFTSGTALWFGENPHARVIGITGTKGKSTTAAMTAHLARSAGVRTALAGNIGLPLLELDGQQADLWVLELSSFQTGEAGPLDVGVVTCLYEEHLDWHGSAERYVADKLKLAAVSRTLIVNAAQQQLLDLTASHRQRVGFGGQTGWHLHDGGLWHDTQVVDPRRACLAHLPGQHNALDACAALSALECVRPLADTAARAARAATLARYVPLPHRLQMLGARAGLIYMDDSISTTPEATRAAVLSQPERGVTVILGGYDRGLDWTSFARFARTRADLRCIVQGANGLRIRSALRAAGVAVDRVHTVCSLSKAVARAQAITPAGDVVLLSPGAPSFDQFRNYAERGRRFAGWAGFDPKICGVIKGLGVI